MQNFPQYDLYNETLRHVRDHWTITWDNGTIPGYNDWECRETGRCRLGAYNLSNPDMRSSWWSG